MDLLNVSLQGKVTIVTGARRGIGKALALGFARAGSHVALCDHVVEDGLLEAVAREIEDSGRPSLAIQADVTKKNDVERMVQKVIEQLGGVDILINNAGMIPRATPLEISEEMWDTVMAVNLKGCLLCSQAAAKRMIEQQRGGSIIHISSVAGIEANVNRAGYASSKAGLIMLTRQMAIELGAHNIRVNNIAPSNVKTEWNRDIYTDPEKSKQRLSIVPIKRWVEPTETVNAALFLASDFATYITGITLPVDGGRLAGVTLP
jgi:NAD(P)-dependent dehydrogenase (short-subunit alcohol dehydrogenase family)